MEEVNDWGELIYRVEASLLYFNVEPVRDLLRGEGLEQRVGYFGRRIAVADAIDESGEGSGAARGDEIR